MLVIQESESTSGLVEEVREELLAVVRLEREIGHIVKAMEHVDGVIANLQSADVPEVR